MTLQGVAQASGGTFKPTALAGYERGERRISLQRFCDLARFYDIRPELLLAEIMESVEGVPDVIVVDVRTNEERAPSDA
jgi:transcriptional regulator with XRE-family HTH domain